MDERNRILAQNLLSYSVAIAPGEKILIEVFDQALPLAEALVEEAFKCGALPFISLYNNRLQRLLILGGNNKQWEQQAQWDMQRMEEMDAYIALRASDNNTELSDVPPQQMNFYQHSYSLPVHTQIRVPKTKWCVLRYPSPSMAQSASMSTPAFEDFYFQVCTLNYQKMADAMEAAVALLAQTDTVRIQGPGTDISFSIQGLPGIKCCGKRNIPDGEIYSAPVKDSIKGQITFNTPAVYQGFTYENICLHFKNGKVTDATANNSQRLNQVLDTDEGARYIGEFALGVNPYILHPMKDTLFDEKICGSLHLAAGNAYTNCFNGNHSAIHWDLVLIQRPEYGGGKIWFDDRLVRLDGRFVIPELEALNPENLQ